MFVKQTARYTDSMMKRSKLEIRMRSRQHTVGMTVCAYVLPRTTRRSYMMLP